MQDASSHVRPVPCCPVSLNLATMQMPRQMPEVRSDASSVVKQPGTFIDSTLIPNLARGTLDQATYNRQKSLESANAAVDGKENAEEPRRCQPLCPWNCAPFH